MAEGRFLVFPGGDEFLSDEPLVASLDYGAHNSGVVDLLRVVQLGSTGIAGRMVVTDEILILSYASNDVAVHDLHMVYVEEKFHMWRADAADEIRALIDVITEIAGMALHRVRVVAGVEVLKH